ncbi:hypothetical protein DPX16_23700 [Anabarilius grahami]|uniref:Uncharacterized protein n=1 Tax=Anabarilius grahami TaxID=495550 RepID=A0A3N0Y7Q7_ANAGA|nr:hypothetical protein DPX16_23700 [Anabarilius grahami]
MLPGVTSRLQSDEGHPQSVQEAGYMGSYSEVPGSTQATLSQLPMARGPSHGSFIGHSIRDFTLSPISALVDSQTVVSSPQPTYPGMCDNQLFCLPESLETGTISAKGRTNGTAPGTQGSGYNRCGGLQFGEFMGPQQWTSFQQRDNTLSTEVRSAGGAGITRPECPSPRLVISLPLCLPSNSTSLACPEACAGETPNAYFSGALLAIASSEGPVITNELDTLAPLTEQVEVVCMAPGVEH